jgi:hypothetical protein
LPVNPTRRRSDFPAAASRGQTCPYQQNSGTDGVRERRPKKQGFFLDVRYDRQEKIPSGILDLSGLPDPHLIERRGCFGGAINTRRGESFQTLEKFFIDTIIDQGIETPMGG